MPSCLRLGLRLLAVEDLAQFHAVFTLLFVDAFDLVHQFGDVTYPLVKYL